MRSLILLMFLSLNCLGADEKKLDVDYKKWQLIEGEWQLEPVAEFQPQGAYAVMDSHHQIGEMIVIRMPFADCKTQQDTTNSAGTMVWGDDYRGTREIVMLMQCTAQNQLTLFPSTDDGAQYIWDSFMSGTSQVTGSVTQGGPAVNLVFVSLNFLYASSNFLDSVHK